MENAETSETLRTRKATSERDVLAATQLRYEVYIAEQGKPYPQADHANRTLTDDLDQSADVILVSGKEDAAYGTVRCNSFDCPATALAYDDVFQINELSPILGRQEMVVCSRLAVHPEHRNSAIRDALFVAIYTYRLSRGTRLCFATCSRQLLRMFRFYGFREYLPPIEDAFAGQLHRTVLVLDDIEYLSSINSPFWRVAISNSVVSQGHAFLNRFFENMEKK